MARLRTDQLVEGLQYGRPVAPFSIDDEMLDRYIEEIRRRRMTLDTEAEETRQLASLISEPLSLIEASVRSQLSRLEIYVLPLPLCIAYCEQNAGRSRIVVGSGLIDLIASTILASGVDTLVPAHLNDVRLLNARRNMALGDFLTNALFLRQFRFYAYAEDLPNIQAILPNESLGHVRTSIAGAVLFVLLHELGHITLGHLESDTVHPMRYELIIDQQLSPDQQQEFEADAFGLNAFKEDTKEFGAKFQQFAVEFFTQLELVSAERSGQHPLALNRSFVADAKRNEWGKPHGVRASPNDFRELAEKFRATEEHIAARGDMLLGTPPERLTRVLHDVVDLLAVEGIDIKEMLSTKCPTWLESHQAAPGMGFGQGGIP